MRHQTLKQAREAKGWTQKELEHRSGIAQARISQIELGVTRDPQNETVKSLEEALSLKRGTLVFGDEAQSLEQVA